MKTELSSFNSKIANLVEERKDELIQKPERELKILEDHFLTTSRFEYLFWDMVYDGNEWPV